MINWIIGGAISLLVIYICVRAVTRLKKGKGCSSCNGCEGCCNQQMKKTPAK